MPLEQASGQGRLGLEQRDFCKIGDFDEQGPFESAEKRTFVFILPAYGAWRASVSHACLGESSVVIYNDAECPPLTGK